MSGPVLCPFRLCTGQACPGCGLTRSVLAAVQGDIERSIQFHPLTGVLALQALILAVVIVLVGRERALRHLRVIGALNLVLLLSTWAVRWRFGMLDIVTEN